MHSYIGIYPIEWLYMSMVLSAKSQVLHKHLDSRVSMFLGHQLKEVEICCIVAFNGKVVNGLHGQTEP
jgi:hypothetical protein